MTKMIYIIWRNLWQIYAAAAWTIS